jgi:predicted RND superfamily exporter protein
MQRFFKHPWIIVAVIGVITIFFAFQLPKAQLDNNNFRFVPDKDPARLSSQRIDDTFGSQIYILVGLECRHGNILDADFLKKVLEFGKRVRAMPIVSEVTSIATADYIGGSADAITVEPLVPENFSGTPEEIALVKDRLLEWDMYRRALVSDDFTATQVLISLDTTTEKAGTPEAVQAYRDVKLIAEKMGFADTQIYVTGMPVFSGVVNDAMGADLTILIPLVILAVLIVLFLSFRRLSGIVLPILTVAISATWAIGAMSLLGFKLSIISTVLPVILVAVGSAYCVHVVSHYYDETAGKKNLSDEEHRSILFEVLRKFGKPVFLAAFTDATGFAALCFTPVVPIREFGLFSTFGILIAFIVALTLIPALILIHGPSKSARGAEAPGDAKGGEDRLSRTIADIFCAIASKRRTVLITSAAVVALSLFGVSHLVIDNVLVEYFKSGTDVVRSDEFIRKYFGGSKSVSVVLSGEKPGDVLRPDVLAAMDGLSDYLARNVPEVGKTTGFTDLVKRINQVFNADESPSGIARAGTENGAGVDSGFGFEAATASAQSATPVTPVTPATQARVRVKAAAVITPTREAIDELTMVKMLSAALAKGGHRDMSADELVASLARSVNYRGASYYEIPTDPARYGKTTPDELKALISNYLVLLSGNISSFADDALEPRSIRLNIQLRTIGQMDTNRAIDAIKGYVAARFPKDIKVEIGGTALVEESLNKLVVQSQLSSLPLSLFFVFMTLAAFYRSALAGLIGIAPLGISILINFGVMGALGIKLNIGTALVASIAIGIGIDYMIHYMAAYHRESLKPADGSDFLRRTFLTSGKAIIFNAASVGAGFAVLLLSRFNMLACLGGLMALTMGTSALVSLTVLPMLLTTLQPAFIKRPLPFDKITADTEVSQ